MKKIILGTVLAVVAVTGAHATTASICAGSAGNGAAATAASDGSTFVRTAFNPKCSANVHMVGDDMQTYYRVGATSTKGKNSFGGSSAGGAISGSSCASATGCTSADAASAATNASSGTSS